MWWIEICNVKTLNMLMIERTNDGNGTSCVFTDLSYASISHKTYHLHHLSNWEVMYYFSQYCRCIDNHFRLDSKLQYIKALTRTDCLFLTSLIEHFSDLFTKFISSIQYLASIHTIFRSNFPQCWNDRDPEWIAFVL